MKGEKKGERQKREAEVEIHELRSPAETRVSRVRQMRLRSVRPGKQSPPFEHRTPGDRRKE